MHAIQTSGNCIRNVTADHFAGAAADEIEDPRPTAELIRQWSSAHPEFRLPAAEIQIAVTGSPNDRAVTKAHDIGLRMLRDESGAPGYEVIVGGGMGRTPMIGKVIRDFLPKADLLPYLEAILRVYNLYGRRDNKYKARIKILVHERGSRRSAPRSRQEFAKTMDGPRDRGQIRRRLRGSRRISRRRSPSMTLSRVGRAGVRDALRAGRSATSTPGSTSTRSAHARAGLTRSLTISLKPIGGAPGDADGRRRCAPWPISPSATRHDEIRVSHEQNLVLPHAPLKDDAAGDLRGLARRRASRPPMSA